MCTSPAALRCVRDDGDSEDMGRQSTEQKTKMILLLTSQTARQP